MTQSVFSCGIREENNVTKAEAATGKIGCYWTSNCSKTEKTQASSLYFQDMTNPFIPDSGIYTEDTSYRGTARNVRLVRDVLERQSLTHHTAVYHSICGCFGI